MKIITNRKQKEIDNLIIKKLRFVARATYLSVRNLHPTENDLKIAMDKAEDVFYADDVI